MTPERFYARHGAADIRARFALLDRIENDFRRLANDARATGSMALLAAVAEVATRLVVAITTDALKAPTDAMSVHDPSTDDRDPPEVA